MGNLFYYPLRPRADAYSKQFIDDWDERCKNYEESNVKRVHKEYLKDFYSYQEKETERANLFHTFRNNKNSSSSEIQNDDDLDDFRLMFQAFDTNCDYLIDIKELSRVLEDYGIEHNEQDLEVFFNKIDVNNTGTIDFEQFVNYINKNSKLDANHNNRLDVEFIKFVKHGAGLNKKLRSLSLYKQLKNDLI